MNNGETINTLRKFTEAEKESMREYTLQQER